MARIRTLRPLVAKQRQDLRSEEAAAYRKLYKTARWKRIRAAQLYVEPLCQRCGEEGRITVATVCHHTDPKTKASEQTFFAGPFMSLCQPCHDGPIQSEERTGRRKPAIGVDGWPIGA